MCHNSHLRLNSLRVIEKITKQKNTHAFVKNIQLSAAQAFLRQYLILANGVHTVYLQAQWAVAARGKCRRQSLVCEKGTDPHQWSYGKAGLESNKSI